MSEPPVQERRPGDLGPAERQSALASFGTRHFDVLVIGGGVVGAGVALDAATRGLSVALVEARDFASGTSSRSSKLIHGGLRYLELLDFNLVREALTERSLLLERIAPHLVHTIPFLYPLTHRVWERSYVGSGLFLYDLLRVGNNRGRAIPWHRHLSKREALQAFPGLKSGALSGGIRYYDCQVDDARFVTALLRTAASHGAEIANQCEAVELLRDGDRITGAKVVDREGGVTRIPLRATAVISATGVWTPDIAEMLGKPCGLEVTMSKGVHIVVPRGRIDASIGLTTKTEKSVLFIIPWGRHWIIGTTDTEWQLDKVHPAVSDDDVEYLLARANSLLAKPLTRGDIEAVYAGLRPLVSRTSSDTTRQSREHAVARPAPGLTLVAGGKFTTYRLMAKDALHAALDSESTTKSVTDNTPLLGAVDFKSIDAVDLATQYDLEQDQVQHLLSRYGSRIYELLRLAEEQPALRWRISGAPEYLGVEVHYAVSHEGALHLDDVLMRRTRISIETSDQGIAAAEPVARIMAPLLGWSDGDIAHEIQRYNELR